MNDPIRCLYALNATERQVRNSCGDCRFYTALEESSFAEDEAPPAPPNCKLANLYRYARRVARAETLITDALRRNSPR